MNVSKYTMSEEMARDAVLSLTHMPSIAENVHPDGAQARFRDIGEAWYVRE